MKKINFDDKDLVIVAITIITLVAIFLTRLEAITVKDIYSMAVASLGSLAVGVQIGHKMAENKPEKKPPEGDEPS